MSIDKTYSPNDIETKWNDYWQSHNLFHSEPNANKEPYTIVIPPPNVTGILHMGHVLNNTIQDVVIRRARMQGFEACWVPGTDHASIATEAKVVAKLREEGIKKSEIGREKFLEHAWDWKEKYGGIILKQLKTIGCSCDWQRTAFTMDAGLSKAVIDTFVDLHEKGHIYRSHRMVNWDPVGRTAVSDEEVIHKEVQSQLYYVQYAIKGSDQSLTVATTRPETIPGDVAVCVNPDDDRYKNLIGQTVIVPLVNREVKIMADEYVDKEFGTGCLKITPAHDINDYEIGTKHNLTIIDVLHEDGTYNAEAAGLPQYDGQDRFIVRKKIAKELEAAGLIVKTENLKNSVGFSERTDAVIEPRLSLQWFLNMKELAAPALENVLNGEINFHPNKFINTYKYWMENVHDWCISRQLWWGHRIPAWYLPDGSFVVGRDEAEALQKAREKNKDYDPADLTQDEDVLDTWFSSWLWPISVFDGINNPDNAEINYYYPTNVLVTAPEILFFWVARMAMAGYEYRGQKPFSDVYLTGIVRDKQRRKMSKSLGNSPDPLQLVEQYGADAVRSGMLFSSPAGNDLLYDEKLIEQGRNFNNKIWNAFRLMHGWTTDESLKTGPESKVALQWFEAKLNAAITELDQLLESYRLSEALMLVYKLIWNDFCAWYLEAVKPAQDQPVSREVYDTTFVFFEKLMKLLHPFMPFITEELWQQLQDRQEGESICIANWPRAEKTDEEIIKNTAHIFEVVTQIRNTRSSNGMSYKKSLDLLIQTNQTDRFEPFRELIGKMANIDKISFETPAEEQQTLRFAVGTDTFFVPVDADVVNVEEQKATLQKDLKYARGFLKSVEKKLANERFVQNAPEAVIAAERKKQTDTEAKIQSLEEALGQL